MTHTSQPTTPSAVDSVSLPDDAERRIQELLTRGLALEEGLLSAQSSHDLVEAALTYLVELFNASAFFLVQGPIVVGREAKGDTNLGRLIFPSDSPTTFGQVIRTRQPYFGPIAPELTDATLHHRARRPVPEEVFCVPVVLEGTCVGLVYADRLDRGAPIDPSLPHRFGRMVGSAFLDLFSRDLEGMRAEAQAEEAPEEKSETTDAARDLIRKLSEAKPSQRDLPQLVAETVKLGKYAREPLIEFFPGVVDELALTDPERATSVQGHGGLIDAVLQMGTTGISVALAAISDSSAHRRRYGALVLTRLPTAEAIGPLVALLDDPDEAVASACALALGSLREPALVAAAEERLLERLDPTLPIGRPSRSRLITIAGRLGCTHCIDLLLRYLDDPVLGMDANRALASICYDEPTGKTRGAAWHHYLGTRAWYREKDARERFALEAMDKGESDRSIAAALWLGRKTGQDFGYRKASSRREREEALARWRKELSL